MIVVASSLEIQYYEYRTRGLCVKPFMSTRIGSSIHINQGHTVFHILSTNESITG